jgi:toxin-antitoxin system PIN domain toxin
VSVTVDANVLVYASNEADEAHSATRNLIERLAAGPEIAYLLWPALMGYLRIVTHHVILPRPLAPSEAIANIDALLAQPHVRAAGAGDRFWTLYRSAGGDEARGNHVPDVQLVALMREHGIATIYTRDRGFRRFDGINAIDPLEEAGRR